MADNSGRVAREKVFHDQRFSEPSKRTQKVKRFYKITNSVRSQYWDFLEANAAEAQVLEYGCGTGSYAFDLARYGAQVTGIDISQVALDQARERAQNEGLGKNIDFLLMNAESLDFADNSFDLVCGTGILHHLQLDRALAEVARVLKQEGKAIFIEPLGHSIFINLYRSLTPNIRSEDEHPLLSTDLAEFQRYFERVQLDHFYFMALIATLPGFGFLLNSLESLDSWLFRWAFWQRQAWQVMIRLSVRVSS